LNQPEHLFISRELRTTLAIMAIVLIVGSPLIFADAPVAQPTTSYLALVFQDIPTPTPTPIPVKQLINGGFEQGPGVGWTTNTTSLVIVRNAGMARSGEWSAWLGSSRKDLRILQQEIDVTAEAPYLVYWSAVYSDERNCTYDYGYVRTDLLGLGDSVNEFCISKAHDEEYRKRVVDLRRAIGYRGTVQFIMSTDVNILSAWHIDDVRMQATP